MSNSRNCWIVDAVRTPTGKRNGSLSGYHPAELGALVVDALVERTNLHASILPIEDVIIGCVSQVGSQSANIARGIVLASSLPTSVPATTVDRQCGSSLQALTAAANQIWAGSQCLIAGGVEVMSAVPLGSAYDLQTVVPRPSRRVNTPNDKSNIASTPLRPTPTAGSSTTPAVTVSVPRYAVGLPLPSSVLLALPMPNPRSLPPLPILAHAHPFSISALYPLALEAADVLAQEAITAQSTPSGPEYVRVGKKLPGGEWFYSFKACCPYQYVAAAEKRDKSKFPNPYLPPLAAYIPLESTKSAKGFSHLPAAGAHSQFVGADVTSRKYGLCLCSLLEYARLSWYRANMAARHAKAFKDAHIAGATPTRTTVSNSAITSTSTSALATGAVWRQGSYGEELVAVPVRTKADAVTQQSATTALTISSPITSDTLRRLNATQRADTSQQLTNDATQRMGAIDPAQTLVTTHVSCGLPDADVLHLARAGAYGEPVHRHDNENSEGTPSTPLVDASIAVSVSMTPTAPAVMLSGDETLRPVPSLATLLTQCRDKPIPPTSWVTAPLASQVSDGASMALLCDDKGLQMLGYEVPLSSFSGEVRPTQRPATLEGDQGSTPRPAPLDGIQDAMQQRHPLGRVISVAVAAGDPVCMLDQVGAAVLLALQRANTRLQLEWIQHNSGAGYGNGSFRPLTANDPRIVFELNEAFASVPLAAARALGLRADRVNVEGGAIALGHPLGATGVKLIASGCRTARRLGCKYLCVGVCEGGGMANAVVVEVLGVAEDEWLEVEQEDMVRAQVDKTGVSSKL